MKEDVSGMQSVVGQSSSALGGRAWQTGASSLGRQRERESEAGGGGAGGTQVPVLAVKDLTVRLRAGGHSVYAVNGVSLSLDRGETLAVIGETGCGKTLTGRAIIGLVPRYAEVRGSVQYNGRELVGLSQVEMRRHRGRDLAMVFQDSGRSLNPTMRVGEQISESLQLHHGMSRRGARERSLELLEVVRIPSVRERFEQYPHELSGGMRQRVMIAVAIACGPRVLIADEATTALDVTTQAVIMELLCDLQAELDMSMIIISHDMGIAAGYADRVIVMYCGRVVEEGTVKQIFDSTRMPYTSVLLEAIPRVDGEAHARLRAVPGAPPDMRVEPKVCSFAERCPYAQERCRSAIPPLEEHEPGHRWACYYPVNTEW